MKDFGKDLKKSNSDETRRMLAWNYRRRFGQKVEIKFVEDLETQRLGIDTILTTDYGRVIRVEEKIRYGRYTDVALEIRHEYDNGHVSQGWIEKPMFSDLLLYVVKPLNMAYWFSVPMLQSVWKNKRDLYLSEYPVKSSQNRGYRSYNCCIPQTEIKMAMGTVPTYYRTK